MTPRKQQESFLLGFIAAGTLAFSVTLAASLLPIFDTETTPSPATEAASQSDAVPIEAAPDADPEPQSSTGIGSGRGRGGGPPEGRGPGSAAAAEVHGEPLSQGTAADEVLTAFEAGGCVACHSIKGVGGGAAVLAPPLFRTGATAVNRRSGASAEAYIEESILDPNVFIAPNCPNGPCVEGLMPQTYGQTLSPDQIATIVNYVAALGTAGESDVLSQP